MYQNAPPQYNNQGGYPQQQQQNQYGGNPGYYDQQQQQPINNQYNNNTQPSPVNAAYQRANAAMTRGPSPSPNIGGSPLTGGPNNNPAGSSSAASGLIRLTLRKPMGIVFEPMTDPHNPSQQRGVRICDLPRTGAAAMSLKLQVGDELLSINDKTMSRLTFDEIMDFIIEADKERVDLLFRRPTKAQVGDRGLQSQQQGTVGGANGNDPMMGGDQPSSPTGLGGIGSQSNSVKWIDEKSDLGARGKLAAAEDSIQEEPRKGGRGGSNKHSSARDEYSVDDEGTYDDGGYTVESQSQYTMETYEEDTRGGHGRKGRGGGRYNSSRRDRDHRRDSRSSRHRDRDDPMESGGFLDLLIDTLCTGVMGRDARDMCGDGRSGKGSRRSSKYDDDDDDFTLDDGTYATYEEDSRRRGGRHNEDESLATNEDTFVTEDDGTRTLEEQEEWRKHRQKSKEESKKSSSSSNKSKNNKVDQQDQFDDDGFMAMDNQFQNAGMNDPPLNHMPSAPDPPTKMASQSRDNIRMAASAPISNHQQQQPQIVVDHQMNEHESAIASGMPLPVKELEYVDGHDYAADVSVMESLGGPSLLVERARHENAVGAGADRANFESLEMQDPELGELVAKHGEGFTPDPGMTKDETAFRDPYKFYEFAVCNLLKENEPEKVRLLSKLMAKYRGRERHLINKLSARYTKEKAADEEDEAADPTVGNSKSNASEASNTGNKQSMKSGMDKIQEGDDGEEGSSFLNDPSRANMAAIEAAKKKMENVKSDSSAPQDEGGIPIKKSSNEDGWPPAMSDPWGGAGGQAATTSSAAARDPSTSNNYEEDGSRSRPMHDDDEGSFSGSSYTESGDEVDGTSPAIIAQVSELLNYVYGKTSVAGQIDRVSTIMRAYEGREAVLLELLETKALIKANADSNNQEDLPTSLRNAPGLKTSSKENGDGNNNATTTTGGPPKKLTPSTPSGVSVLTAPTMAGGTHPASSQVSPTATAGGDTISPSANTLNSTTSKKKKKGVFGGFFGGKKKDKKSTKGKASPQGKSKNKKTNKKGQQLNNDDGSI